MTAFNWNIPASADYVISSNNATDMLAAINSHFTANSGGANAKWEVAGSSASTPRYVILKRKSGAAGRIGFFGETGSTPNTASIYGGSGQSGELNVCYSATGTSNAPINNWTSGAFFTDSDFMPGMRCSPGSTATWRLTYAEFADGVVILISNSSSGPHSFGAGSLILDTAGAAVPTVYTSGTTAHSSWATTNGAGGAFDATVAADSAYSHATGNPGLLVRTSGANRMAFRSMIAGTSVTGKLNDNSNTISYFLPIPLVYSTTLGTLNVLGKMRQIAFGPNCDRETSRNNGSGTYAYGHQSTTASGTAPGLWFVDLEV